jgi:RNA polymerase sigma factor (sigma-70 family)
MDEHVARLKSGDRNAAEALIARYEMRVRLYAAKVAPRAGMAEDIAQKAFLLALQNIHKFDPAGDFGVWMCGIVRNVGRQEWKRLATHSRVERDGLSDYIEEIAEMPATLSSEGEWLDKLRDCIDRLPDRAKETSNCTTASASVARKSPIARIRRSVPSKWRSCASAAC